MDRNGQESGRPRQRGLSGCSAWGIPIWLILLIAAPWIWGLLAGGGEGPVISYSTFQEHVESGLVDRVVVEGEEVTVALNEPVERTENGQTTEYEEYVTYVPSFGDEELLNNLRAADVEIETRPADGGSLWPLLLNLLPTVLLIGAAYFLFGRMRGQGQDLLQVGKSRAKRYQGQKQRTTFDDVAGAHGAKEELEEVIDFLKHPQRFQRLGAEIPTGVLLVGPPGTGKTLLARAVAGEAGVPFFSITGSDFMEMFVGVGASRVRDLFDEAKKASPAIIFVDELDSIGRRRGAGVGGGHDEREQTLNQLLSEMDGFETNEGVIVMAATNRPDILDPALLRPGRFDRRITVDLPTMKDREAILEIHSRNKPLADDVDLRRLARGTPGFSGADLENLLNEAALLAAREQAQEIQPKHVDEARDKILLGLERGGMALTEDELRLLAYHEGGHAVVAAVLPNADPIHKVTIVPRGRAMGVTQQLPERDKYVYPWEYMLDRLAVMMGGRAAEKLVLNTVTSGAQNDLREATKQARRMVLQWGVSEKLGPVAYSEEEGTVFLGEELGAGREYSEDTARQVDEEIRKILNEAYQRAADTLTEYREGLDKVADALVENEEIPGERVLKIVGMREKLERQEAETFELGSASAGAGAEEAPQPA